MLGGISSTTGGRSAPWMRAVAAASGGSTPTLIAASGSVLSLPAIKDTELASRKGSVICQFLLKARQGDPEK